MLPRPRDESPTSALVAERVQSILATKGLTLYRVSQQSATIYGRSSPYFVPHNLYYDLRCAEFTPSIQQIFALSRISGYRLQDWLRIFGVDLEDITRFQVLLPLKRTILLDTSLTNENEQTAWVRNRRETDMIPAIAPLVEFLELVRAKTMMSLPRPAMAYLYAKIGSEDAIAFPEFIPGSIVRVNLDVDKELASSKTKSISEHLFLIEHRRGFYCCRIRKLPNGGIVPVDNGLSYAQIELRFPLQAKLWGYVDLEFRPLLDTRAPYVPRDLARRWKPEALRSDESLGQLLRQGRDRLHMSTREAAAMSRLIAELQKDDRYESSSSSMSDYEVGNSPPRRLHKVVSLCSIYGLQFASVMREIGVDVQDAGAERLPDRYLFRREDSRQTESHSGDSPGGFFGHLLGAFQNAIPFFLRDQLQYFSGARKVVLEDFFWIGGDPDPLHPYLVNGLLAIVNRRRKTPMHFPSKPLWHQPIYIFLARDGRYRAACCGLENDRLVVHPYGPEFHLNSEYRYHRDAEIVGQIVAVARRFP